MTVDEKENRCLDGLCIVWGKDSEKFKVHYCERRGLNKLLHSVLSGHQE